MLTTSVISEISHVTTTIRYEPGLLASEASHDDIADKFKTMSDFYLLPLHQDKVMNAAKNVNWPVQLVELYSGDRGLQILFAKLLLHIHEDRRVDGPLQIHLALAKDGLLDISSCPAAEPGLLFPVDLFDENPGPILERFGTLYKRSPVLAVVDDDVTVLSGSLRSSTAQSSRSKQASTTQERLLVSQYGEILQGQFTTPYFLWDGVWITPAFSGSIEESVTRRYALEHGLCKEGIILRSSLEHGDECWLSDGVRGFFKAKIFILPSNSKKNFPRTLSNHDVVTAQPDKKEQPKGEQKCTFENEEDDQECLIMPSPSISVHKSQPAKRPNPFTSSPPSRRSQRVRPELRLICLAGEDERSLPRAIPDLEHESIIYGHRPPRS